MRRPYPNLATFLRETGTTQQQFAAAVGTTQPLISRLVNGRQRSTRLDLALRIAEAANIPVESLVRPDARSAA